MPQVSMAVGRTDRKSAYALAEGVADVASRFAAEMV